MATNDPTKPFDPIALGAKPVTKPVAGASFDPIAMGAKVYTPPESTTNKLIRKGTQIAMDAVAPVVPGASFLKKAVDTVSGGGKGPGYLLDVARRTGESFKKTGEEIATDVSKAGVRYNNATPVERAAIAGQEVASAAGKVGIAAFEPITIPLVDAIKKISEKAADLPLVQRLAASQDVGKIVDAIDQGAADATMSFGDFAKKNPDLARGIKSATDILLTIAGEGTGAKVGAKVGKVFEDAATASRSRTLKLLETQADDILRTDVRGGIKSNVAETFKSYGIEPPVSAITESPVLRGTEAYLQGSAWLGGSKIAQIVDNARTNIGGLIKSLQRKADSEVLKTSGISASSVGDDLKKSLSAITDEFNSVKSKLYDEATARIGNQTAVLDQTRAALTEMVSDLKQSAVPTSKREAAFLERILNNLNSAEGATYRVIKQTRSDVGAMLAGAKRGVPIENADVGRLKRLYGALSDDLEATITQSGDDAARALTIANAYYKAGKQKLNSLSGRLIKNARSPELLVEKLIKPKDVTAINEVKELVGDEVFDKVSRLFMNNVIDSVTNKLTGKPDVRRLVQVFNKYGEETLVAVLGEKGVADLKDLMKALIVDDIIEKSLNAEGKVMPGQLTRAIDSYGENILKEAFTPEELAKLRDVQTMSGAMAKGTRLVEGSPTAEKLGPLAISGIVGAISIPALITKIAVEWGVSKLFTSPWGRRLLTKGKIRANAGPKAAGAVVVPNVSAEAPKTTIMEDTVDTVNLGGTPKTNKPAEKTGTEAFGVAAGVQTDENGNVSFNPIGAALGVAGASTVKKGGLIPFTLPKTQEQNIIFKKSAKWLTDWVAGRKVGKPDSDVMTYLSQFVPKQKFLTVSRGGLFGKKEAGMQSWSHNVRTAKEFGIESGRDGVDVRIEKIPRDRVIVDMTMIPEEVKDAMIKYAPQKEREEILMYLSSEGEVIVRK